jgi:thiamine pyridinylase
MSPARWRLHGQTPQPVRARSGALRALIRVSTIYFCAAAALESAPLHAGAVLVVNASSASITCRGDASDGPVSIAAGSSGKITLGVHAAKATTLSSVDCGQGLRTRAMNVTQHSGDRFILINGRQRRVLNVLLYSAIPTDPEAGFLPLVRGITKTYQASHPDVLLNIILDPDVDSYDFATLRNSILGKDGVDIAELDTVFLQYLHDNNLIIPLAVNPSAAWPVANQAVTLGGTTFGVPSWLCSDFLFSAKSEDGVATFAQLRTFLQAGTQGPTLTADLDGTWTIPSLYIQAATQMHHRASASEALGGDIDAEAVTRLAEVGTWCERSTGNPCIDKTFHSANNKRDGSLEQEFDARPTLTDIGFSERSFYIDYYAKKHEPLHLIAFPWADQPGAAHLVYVDAFVVSAANCNQDPCKEDAIKFATFATSTDTKKYVTLSKDLKAGSPPRHLLAASRAFYDDSEIRNDALYSQVHLHFLSGRLLPYATDFTPERQYNFLTAICPKLQTASSKWKCTPPPKPTPGTDAP